MSARRVSSLHAHTFYCDGTTGVDEMVEAAIDEGLAEIGFTSHAPLPFDIAWAMSLERLDAYMADVEAARERYADRIRVRLGLEIDYVPDERVLDFQRRELFPRGFEYFVASVHFLGAGYPPTSYEGDPQRFRAILRDDYAGDIEAMVSDYYRRVRVSLTHPGVAIVGHIDRIKRWNEGGVFFRDDASWYRDAVEETLRSVAGAGKIVELNTSGWRKGSSEPYPAPWILERCREHGIPILITADAHAPDQIAWGFDRAEACLGELGIEPVPAI